MYVATTKNSEKRATDGGGHYAESRIHAIYFYKVFYARKVYIIQVMLYKNQFVHDVLLCVCVTNSSVRMCVENLVPSA